MKNKIDIENGRYWDRAWSLVDGCTPCSPGCDHCWSAGMVSRFSGSRLVDEDGSPYIVENGKFTGEIIPHPDRLNIPFKTRKPTVFAVWNDLFHESVPAEFVQAAYTTMANARQHTFLVLTKRAKRMCDLSKAADETGLTLREVIRGFNLPNVWHGLTVCNQKEVDAKIPIFLLVPGKKFLSIEPMLSDINFGVDLFQLFPLDNPDAREPDNISAVILGGETGPGARPMHPDWVRSARDQCAAAGVPFFFKQWGEHVPGELINDGRPEPWRRWQNDDPESWFLEEYGKHDNPSVNFFRSGHVRAGRLLDGRTHDDLPWAKGADHD